MKIKIKICGLTNTTDVATAIEYGADYLGFIFAPKSPRFVTSEQAAELTRGVTVTKVGVFVDETPEKVIEIMELCNLDIAQLHGSETVEVINKIGRKRVWKAVKLTSLVDIDAAAALPCAAILVDSTVSDGGTGKCADWELAAIAAKRMKLILAGGLNPQNIAEAIDKVKPFAIDLCSGVEKTPGIKDKDKLIKILRNKNV